MYVRLIASKKAHGLISVYPLLCMDCEGDVFEWLDSYENIDARTDEWNSFSTYRCVHCRREVRLADNTHLMEATDDKDAWIARRHVTKSAGTKTKDPLNKSVAKRSTLSDEVR